MAEVLEGAGFWLPAKFFVDDDAAPASSMEEGKFRKSTVKETHDSFAEFCLPTEFPYHFEAEKDEFLESLLMSTSPQSILGNWSGRSSIGSPNIPPSPPTMPFSRENKSYGDSMLRLSGQIEKLRLDSGEGLGFARHMGPPRSHFRLYPETKASTPSIFHNTRIPQITARQQNMSSGILYGQHQQIYNNRIGKVVVGGTGQAAWSTVGQNPSSNFVPGAKAAPVNIQARSGGVAAVKRECAGTGVFLPRRYTSNNECNVHSSDSRRKPVSAPPFLQERNLPTISKNVDDVKAFVQYHSQPQPQLNGGFTSDYDSVMAAARKEVMLQYRHSFPSEKSIAGREINLPQEWKY